jgi:hypothetical protein
MKDKQQKDIARATISEVQRRLIECKETLNDEVQIRKLKEIRDLIDKRTALHEFPSEWMDEFGTDGRFSSTTVRG